MENIRKVLSKFKGGISQIWRHQFANDFPPYSSNIAFRFETIPNAPQSSLDNTYYSFLTKSKDNLPFRIRLRVKHYMTHGTNLYSSPNNLSDCLKFAALQSTNSYFNKLNAVDIYANLDALDSQLQKVISDATKEYGVLVPLFEVEELVSTPKVHAKSIEYVDALQTVNKSRIYIEESKKDYLIHKLSDYACKLLTSSDIEIYKALILSELIAKKS